MRRAFEASRITDRLQREAVLVQAGAGHTSGPSDGARYGLFCLDSPDAVSASTPAGGGGWWLCATGHRWRCDARLALACSVQGSAPPGSGALCAPEEHPDRLHDQPPFLVSALRSCSFRSRFASEREASILLLPKRARVRQIPVTERPSARLMRGLDHARLNLGYGRVARRPPGAVVRRPRLQS